MLNARTEKLSANTMVRPRSSAYEYTQFPCGNVYMFRKYKNIHATRAWYDEPKSPLRNSIHDKGMLRYLIRGL